MNTATTARLHSFVAAVLMTLATLGAIDHLAASQHTGTLIAKSAAAQRA